MNTQEFIAMLADSPRPPSRSAVASRLGMGLAVSLTAALSLLVILPGDGTSLITRVAMPVFWAKLALPLTMTLAATCVTSRLSQPGVRVGRAWAALILPVGVAWLAALIVLALAVPEARGALILGHTWRVCSLKIMLLSLPALGALLWAMRGLAPTRPRLAGAATGLLAGALGTLAYSLRCPEMHVPFWATWYLLGMAAPALVGGLLGPRAMRW
ncbi:DUF1109 domain-containing protein [Paraburkholderia sp. LEh10]|uniref:DUF1109 domain-containing protein n=1 Tax=Paraburkholderia sp. LEh10 TaxID=2821353 RepID=UPI001AE3CC5A|nr:DUF1109 domain-containing protein [Paraburkholderia sp. LEh10]MBP0589490.1 DUF1109 domain-containing protein [Paraburkholderia sp. LEh10]